MVVTRKPPAPVPTSRTNSAQPIPRVKAKLPQTASDAVNPTGDGPTQVPPQGGDDVSDASPKKGKGKWRAKQKKDKNSKGKKYKKHWGLTGLLTRIFLLWFTIYSLSACPDDQSLKKPICRGLFAFRTLLIEPYLIPPIQHALTHPSIAPYVDRARPVVNYAVDHAAPIALRTQQEFNQRIVPQWNKRIVPLWRKHVVPQWQRHVVPQWQKHVGPYIVLVEQHVGPYVIRAQQEYRQWVEPYAHITFIKLKEWHHRARPYVVLAAHKTYDSYQKAKPYAIPVIHKIQDLLLQLLHFLIQQRREFVDPHVRKIWEHVKELSRGEIKSLADVHNGFTPSLSEASTAASSFISPAVNSSSSLFSKPSQTVGDSESPAPVKVTQESETTPAVASATESTTSPISTPTTSTSSTVPTVSQVSSASSVASSILTSVASTISPSYKAVPVAASTPFSILSSMIPTPSAAAISDDDVDLDQFYADLGLDEEPETSDAAAAAPTPEPIPEETEEELTEKRRLKLEETAKKRADITGRHSKWEKQLEERIEENHKTLRRNLVALRKAAVTELTESDEIRSEVESLVAEAEKYLKGADKYLAGLKRDGKTDEEKRALWERVVNKVDTKFSERLTQTESVVNGWYLKVLEKEIDEVKRLVAEVKDISDRAQADIGLDYAWLDDVTYNDWQRYHDLDRKSENFTEQAYAVQNGTDPSPPNNPIVTAIQDLQAEVQDVVVGFETRLRRIKRNGQRAFGATSADNDVDADLSSGSGPSDKTVSILPIEDGERKPEDSASPANIPPVVIGRNKEEVISALSRAAEQEAQTTSTPGDKDKQPEQVVESFAQEAAAEGHLTTSAHDEL